MEGMTLKDAANVIAAQSEKKDKEILDLFDRIEKESQALEDIAFTDEDKYKVLNSIEYLFVRLRILVEHELVKIKKVISDQATPAALKPFFQSRSVYLAEISAKITLYRDDVKTLERSQYMITSGFIKD